jgi:sugar phosphate isomerase/epimerase
MCIEAGLWGFDVRTGEDYVELLKRMDRPNVRINYDPAATTVFYEDVSPTKNDITVLAPYLVHFHLCDRASTERGQWDFRPIGEGVIDWDPFMTELNRVGFTGNVSVELGWEVPPESPEVVDDAVRRSVKFIEKYFND